jgi:hypothetical protein
MFHINFNSNCFWHIPQLITEANLHIPIRNLQKIWFMVQIFFLIHFHQMKNII